MTATFKIYDGGDVFPFDLSSYTVVLSRSATLWRVQDPTTGYVLNIGGSGFGTSGSMTDFLDQSRPGANLNAAVTSLAVLAAPIVLNDSGRIWDASGFSLPVYSGGAGSFRQVYDVDFNVASTSNVIGPIAFRENQTSGGFARLTFDWAFQDATTDARNGGAIFIYGEDIFLDVDFLSGQVFGSAPNLVLSGSRFGDRLNGVSGNDEIDGRDGNDHLFGGAGDDSIIGGAGRDRLIGGTGDDTISAGSSGFGEVLVGGSGFDKLDVTGFVDLTTVARVTGFEMLEFDGQTRLTQRFFEDLVWLNVAGPNAQLRAADAGAWALGALDVFGVANASLSFIGSDGHDLITGIGTFNLDSFDFENPTPLSLANDLIFAGAGRDTVFGDDGHDTLLGDNDDDRIFGEDGQDSLVGGLGDDSLEGGEGNDTLEGGDGSDTAVGGFGNDTYFVDNAADILTEASAAGTDTVLARLAWTLGANLENLTLIAAATVGTGNALANVINGNGTNNTLSGLDNNDTLEGNNGADTLAGGNGVDDLRGGDGNDSLLGGTDADVLQGGLGADTLAGGTGDDVYLVDDLFETQIENFNEGLDLVIASNSVTLGTFVENLTLIGTGAANGFGNDSANQMLGNVANNQLEGGGGPDTLNGGTGVDRLRGGDGTDSLIGGNNADRFSYGAVSESNGAIPTLADIIGDFQADGRDLIDVVLIDAQLDIRGNNAFAYIGAAPFTDSGQIRAVAGSGSTTLLFNTDLNFATTEMAIRVVVVAGTLDASDFLL